MPVQGKPHLGYPRMHRGNTLCRAGSRYVYHRRTAQTRTGNGHQTQHDSSHVKQNARTPSWQHTKKFCYRPMLRKNMRTHTHFHFVWARSATERGHSRMQDPPYQTYSTEIGNEQRNLAIGCFLHEVSQTNSTGALLRIRALYQVFHSLRHKMDSPLAASIGEGDNPDLSDGIPVLLLPRPETPPVWLPSPTPPAFPSISHPPFQHFTKTNVVHWEATILRKCIPPLPGHQHHLSSAVGGIKKENQPHEILLANTTTSRPSRIML